MKIAAVLRWFACALVLCTADSRAQATSQTSCGFFNENRALDMKMALRINTLNVPRDAPVGTSLYIQEFHQAAPGVMFQCGKVTAAVRSMYGLFGMGANTGVNVGYYAGKIYETEVPGIGVAWFAGHTDAGAVGVAVNTTTVVTDTNGCTQRPGLDIPANSCVTSELKFFNRTAMVLIKTGPVGTGTISAASLGKIVGYATVDNSKFYSTGSISLSGSINVVGTTCKAANVSVPMGSHRMSSLTGIGSVTPKVAFTLALTDCPGFPGYYGAISSGAIPAASENAVTNAGTPIKNSISIRVDPVDPAADAANGVLELAPFNGVLPARGIGVQLLDSMGAPIALSKDLPQNMTLGANTSSLNISLAARYIQTEKNMRGGAANAVATYTIIYQ